MNRIVFLNELRFNLRGISERELQEIIRDQEEYIADAIAAGRTEEEVVRSLGDPKNLAKSLLLETKIEQAESATTVSKKANGILGAIVAVIALAPLNLIFALVPAILILTFVFTGWVLSLAGLFSTIALLFAFLAVFLFVPVGFLNHLAALFLFMGSIGLGCIALYFMFFVTKWVAKGFLAYLRWNLNFIRGRAV